MKVRHLSKLKIKDNTDLFRCPICNSKMDTVDLKSLICQNRHCFDISRNGYINFLMKSVKTEYDKALFQSRNLISKHGFFDPLTESIADIIEKELSDTNSYRRMVLDAGCGEGSHLDQVIKKLNSKTEHEYEGVGMDISKEGIQIASRQYPDCTWCVGDLTRIPFMAEKFNVILNILSPSNYKEFGRLLTNSGILIKVVPGREYLKEIREALYNKTDKVSYSNEKIFRHFCNSFDFLGSRQVQYAKTLDEEMIRHLIKMTPLSWRAATQEIEKTINSVKGSITADFTILYGQKGK